jgi:hypothetical protein
MVCSPRADNDGAGRNRRSTAGGRLGPAQGSGSSASAAQGRRWRWAGSRAHAGGGALFIGARAGQPRRWRPWPGRGASGLYGRLAGWALVEKDKFSIF